MRGLCSLLVTGSPYETCILVLTFCLYGLPAAIDETLLLAAHRQVQKYVNRSLKEMLTRLPSAFPVKV